MCFPVSHVRVYVCVWLLIRCCFHACVSLTSKRLPPIAPAAAPSWERLYILANEASPAQSHPPPKRPMHHSSEYHSSRLPPLTSAHNHSHHTTHTIAFTFSDTFAKLWHCRRLSCVLRPVAVSLVLARASGFCSALGFLITTSSRSSYGSESVSSGGWALLGVFVRKF